MQETIFFTENNTGLLNAEASLPLQPLLWTPPQLDVLPNTLPLPTTRPAITSLMGQLSTNASSLTIDLFVVQNIVQGIFSNDFDVFHDLWIVWLLEIGSLVVTLFILVHIIWHIYYLLDKITNGVQGGNVTSTFMTDVISNIIPLFFKLSGLY